MVKACCIKGCRSSTRNENLRVSFHRFPLTCVATKRKWIEATKRFDANLKPNLKVCSLHFLDKDYIFGTNKLHEKAVPSIFGVLSHSTSENLCVSAPKPTVAIPGQSTTVSESIRSSHSNEEFEQLLSRCLAAEAENRALKDEQLEIKLAWEEDRKKFFLSSTAFITLERFQDKDTKILYYTGVQSFEILNAIFSFVLPSGNISDVILYSTEKKKRHSCKLSAKDQFFLCLIRLRKAVQFEMLGDMFGVSTSTANKVCNTWINLLYSRLGRLNIWPHRDIIFQHVPMDYVERYENVLGSIDCTEFYIQKPSSLLRQSQCYSNYKGSTTLKSLIFTAPNGALLYVSRLFTGSISDKQILEQSGFLAVLKHKVQVGEINRGDIILADKGFNVQQLFNNINLELKIPTYRITGMQFSPDEVNTIRYVAHERIHVERTIGRIKQFHVLSNEISIAALGNFEQVFVVCCLLTNFRNPIRRLSEVNSGDI